MFFSHTGTSNDFGERVGRICAPASSDGRSVLHERPYPAFFVHAVLPENRDFQISELLNTIGPYYSIAAVH